MKKQKDVINKVSLLMMSFDLVESTDLLEEVGNCGVVIYGCTGICQFTPTTSKGVLC